MFIYITAILMLVTKCYSNCNILRRLNNKFSAEKKLSCTFWLLLDF